MVRLRDTKVVKLISARDGFVLKINLRNKLFSEVNWFEVYWAISKCFAKMVKQYYSSRLVEKNNRQKIVTWPKYNITYNTHRHIHWTFICILFLSQNTEKCFTKSNLFTYLQQIIFYIQYRYTIDRWYMWSLIKLHHLSTFI